MTLERLAQIIPLRLRSPLYEDIEGVYELRWWEWRGHIWRLTRVDLRLPKELR